MKADRKTVADLLSGERQYLVPLFQRPYSWEEKHWRAMWEDLKALQETDGEEKKEHFFGPIVTQEFKSDAEVKQYLLIDGQQRLTTLSILLLTLRERLKELGANVEERDILLNRLNRHCSNTMGNRFDYKIIPTVTHGDRENYIALVKNETPPRPASQLVKAYQFFKREIRKSIKNVNEAKSFFGAVINQLTLVGIELDDYENPYTVFETLNYRGSPLNQTDLIRNHLFMLIPDEDEQNAVHDRYWKPLTDYFGDEERNKKQKQKSHTLNDFFRYYLSARENAVVKSTDVYFKIKKDFNKKEQLKTLWSGLEAAFSYYKRLMGREPEAHPLIQKRLARMRMLDVTVHFPLAFNLYGEYESGRLSPEAFDEALFAIETFIVRNIVYRVNSNGLNREFPAMFKKAKEEGKDLVLGLKTVMNNNAFYRRDPAFLSGLKENSLQNNNKTLTKMILIHIEERLSGRERPELLNWEVECVMPESLTPAWKSGLSEKDLNEAPMYVSTLGNLTLVEKGWAHSHKSFGEKKQHFDQSLYINNILRQSSNWGVDDIKRRGERFADVAALIWPEFGLPVKREDLRKSKPIKLVVLGKTYFPKSWSDVFIMTLNRIYEVDPMGFKNILETYPNLITRVQQPSRSVRLDSGYYVVVNYSASDLLGKSKECMGLAGFNISEWNVEYE